MKNNHQTHAGWHVVHSAYDRFNSTATYSHAWAHITVYAKKW